MIFPCYSHEITMFHGYPMLSAEELSLQSASWLLREDALALRPGQG
jgi:hypothetical protein